MQYLAYHVLWRADVVGIGSLNWRLAANSICAEASAREGDNAKQHVKQQQLKAALIRQQRVVASFACNATSDLKFWSSADWRISDHLVNLRFWSTEADRTVPHVAVTIWPPPLESQL